MHFPIRRIISVMVRTMLLSGFSVSIYGSMSFALLHLAEPYSYPYRNFFAFFLLYQTMNHASIPVAMPPSKSYPLKLGNMLLKASSRLPTLLTNLIQKFLSMVILKEYASLLPKYPKSMYGIAFFQCFLNAFFILFRNASIRLYLIFGIPFLLRNAPGSCACL